MMTNRIRVPLLILSQPSAPPTTRIAFFLTLPGIGL